MGNLNIIIMGKSGVGKSTLVNAVMGEAKLAPTGVCKRITLKNMTYKKQICIAYADKNKRLMNVNISDTVGLELDQSITDQTLQDVSHLLKTKRSKSKDDDITVVWFCVQHNQNRFEAYEVKLIQMLTQEYEIPFMIVVTQCDSSEAGMLEKHIHSVLPDISVNRVMAQEKKLRGGYIIPAYGIKELLYHTVTDYHSLKIKILEDKLKALMALSRDSHIKEIEKTGKQCIQFYSNKSKKIGRIPGLCIPFIKGICKDLFQDLNDIAEIKFDPGKSYLLTNRIVTLVLSPLMMIPFLSTLAVQSVIETFGQNYLDILVSVIKKSSDEETQNNAVMVKRIEKEIEKMKKKVDN